MARRKEGYKVVFVEAPIELAERMRVIALRNHRSVNGEAIAAFERHVAAEEAALPTKPATTKGKAKKGGNQ